MTSRHDGEQRDRYPDTENRAENGHSLIAVITYLPRREPSDTDGKLAEGPPCVYRTRFWRCRRCGQERKRRAEFPEPCGGEQRPHPLSDGSYSIDEPRTRRALSEDMTVRFGERGSIYLVESESGTTYTVDIEAETCTCPDFRKRDVRCKHLRRVNLEIRTGVSPKPDGTFRR